MKLSQRQCNLLKDNEQGFIILQGMIAAAIFGISMTAVVYMMVGTIKANTLSTRLSEATAVAADTIEEISSLPYTDTRLQTDTYPQATRGRYTIIVRTRLGALMPDTISIDVEVRWPDPTGRLVGGTRVRSVVIQDIKTLNV